VDPHLEAAHCWFTQSAARQVGRIARKIATEYCDGPALFVLERGLRPSDAGNMRHRDHARTADEAAIPGRQRAILSDPKGAMACAVV
jgi:hypothetical protein